MLVSPTRRDASRDVLLPVGRPEVTNGGGSYVLMTRKTIAGRNKTPATARTAPGHGQRC